MSNKVLSDDLKQQPDFARDIVDYAKKQGWREMTIVDHNEYWYTNDGFNWVLSRKTLAEWPPFVV